MPNASFSRFENIAGDGNCLFNSLIEILKLGISAKHLRQLLYHSSYLNKCLCPSNAKSILGSEFGYGDIDCITIFTKEFNQNICVHFHYFNPVTNEEKVSFCYFKANNSQDFIHLHLHNQHFTPYITAQ